MSTTPTLDPSAPLNYAPKPARRHLGAIPRLALAALYVGLTFLPCLAIVMAGQVGMRVLVGTFLAYAFALLPTYYLDHALLGGVGFHSPAVFALFILVTAAMLWPLPLLSAAPSAWRSRRWRRILLAYAAVFVLFAAAAAWKMTKSWGLFFG